MDLTRTASYSFKHRLPTAVAIHPSTTTFRDLDIKQQVAFILERWLPNHPDCFGACFKSQTRFLSRETSAEMRRMSIADFESALAMVTAAADKDDDEEQARRLLDEVIGKATTWNGDIQCIFGFRSSIEYYHSRSKIN